MHKNKEKFLVCWEILKTVLTDWEVDEEIINRYVKKT